MLKLMMLTNEPEIVVLAEQAGVDRIFFDLEYINKRERQSGRNTVLSNYDIEDIPKVKKLLNKSQLLVRVNPIYFNSKIEIDKAIAYGADIIMLPMVLDSYDVEKFVEYVGGRAKTSVMIETPQSFARIDDILEVGGVDEIFIGLNDLHIGMGLSFMFEVLSGGMVEYIADKCKAKNIPYGFGGVARIGQGELPAENIIGEHYRLGSTSVILSRVFKNCFTEDGKANINFNFHEEINKIRKCEEYSIGRSQQEILQNHKTVKNKIKEIVRNIKL